MIIIIFLVIATIFHLFGHTIACLLSGIRINKIQFFYGNEILKLNWKITTVSVGWLPTGGSVSYDIGQFRKANLFTRLFVILLGPLFVLISAAIFIKYDLALTNFLDGFPQIVAGSLSPFQKGHHLVSNYFRLLSNSNYSIAYSILASKIASFNLLPIPSLNGGNVLLEILSPFLNEKHKMIFANSGFVFGLLLSIEWLIIIIYSII